MSVRLIPVLSLILLLFSACNSSNSTPQTTLVLPTEVSLNTSASENDDTLEADMLRFWMPVEGTLIAGEPVRWRFVGGAGDQITLRAIGQSIDIALRLQGTDGNMLAEGDSIEATLPTGGVYSVFLTSEQSGTYELGLGYADRPNPSDPTPVPAVVGVPTPGVPFEGRGAFISSIADEETVSGELSENDQYHIYTFDGERGRYVQVALTRINGTIDPVMTVYNPDGNPIATDDNSAGERNAILRNIQIMQDGLHSIQVHGDGFFGAYTMTMLVYDVLAPVTPTTLPTPSPTATLQFVNPTPAAMIAGNRLEDHEPVVGILDRPSDVMIHPFYLGAGEIVTVGVSPAVGSQIRPQIEILSPDGSIVASASASTSNAGRDALITPLFSEVEGVYQIFVTGEDNVIGEYVIGFGRGSTWLNYIRGPVRVDNAVEGSIDRRGQRDVWVVALTEGDIISTAVSANEGSALDPILELVPVSDSVTIIAIDDNGGGDNNPLLNNIRIPESGLYYLRVKASQAATVGTYTLIWRYVNRAPTSTPPPATFPVLSVDDFVETNAYNFYSFQGRAGQQVSIAVIADADTLLDPVMALLGVDGEIISEVDDSEGDLNSRLTITLPEDGTYTVRVNGYLSEGAFELSVQELFN